MPSTLSKNQISVPKFKLGSLRAIFLGSSLASLAFIVYFYRNAKRRELELTNEKGNSRRYVSGDNNKLGKPKFDSKFYVKFRSILRILIPQWFCEETGCLAFLSGMLIVRSLCDVWTIYLGTLLESAIIAHDNSKFNRHLLEFGMTMPLMSLVNSFLKYATEKLHISFRSRLTTHLLKKYMTNLTFYKTHLPNIDQMISTDVDRLSGTVAQLYSQMAKPILDILIYIYGISTSVGKGVPIFMLSYLGLAAGILVKIRKPMARLTAREAVLEGEFRFANSRLQTNAEEVAFYGGNKRELLYLIGNFKKLINHLQSYTEFKFIMNILENFVVKYMATVVGYYSVSRPFLTSNNHLNEMTHQERLEAYYKSGRMLINMAQAIGRLVLNGKELSRLAGYTSRLNDLMETFDRLNLVHEPENFAASIQNGVPGAGVILLANNVIKFEKVPIITPNGDVLLKELSLEIKSGTNVLICGPNGCGKSSLFRILGELWPLRGGVLLKPVNKDLFYIPQRPYMPMGTLRDQIIYPDTQHEMKQKGITDLDLLNILSRVDLEWLASDEALSEETLLVGQRRSLDESDNWMDVLSGGQKQRLAMSRLIYHRPQFAILDECTSAVSVDVEGGIYDYCRKVGITLLTVSHRKSLWRFHDFVLHMDGRGNYTYCKIEHEETNQFGS